MASVRTDNVNIKLEVDGSQSRTELDNLTRKSQVLREELKGLKKGTQEYIDKNKEISQNTARIEELRKEIGITALSMTQLKTLSGQLNREIAGLSPGTALFVEKSKQLQEVEARYDQVRKMSKGVGDELEKSGNGFLSFVKKSAAFAGISLGIQEVVNSLKQLGSESIDAAAKGSDSIADMEKSLNVTTEGAKALRKQLEGIDTRTSQEDLEGIAVAGGQLGVAAADVDEFTQSVDQANVALGDEFSGGVEEITKSIGGLQKLFKETADQKPDVAINKIGSALNALGADGSATSPVIADFTARIGQLGDLAPEITQTLGLGAAFQELGLSAEISSGGVTNVLLTASKETEKFSKQLGLTEVEFKKLLNSDPNEVLLRLAASLKGASNTDIISTLDGLGIKSQEATKVVSLLANQTDIVRQKQALASEEFRKGTSLTEEFTKKNTNAAAEIEKSEKNFARYRRELGEQLIPIYIKALQFLGLFIEGLKAAPQFISENRGLLAGLAVALVTLNLANIRATASTLLQVAVEKGRAVATRASAAAQYLLNAAMTANPIGLVVAAVALLVGGFITLYERSERVRETIAGLANVARFAFTNIKEVALETLGGVGNIIAGIFTGNLGLIKAGLADLKSVGSKLSAAYHAGYEAQEAKEHQATVKRKQERSELLKKVEETNATKRAAAVAAIDHAANIERLKQEQAALELRLAKTKEGSEQELALKKQLVLVARNIELEDDKKTAGDRAVIRAKAQVELNKLNQDFAKKQAEQAKKEAEEARKQAEIEAGAAADIEKRKTALIKDEYERRAAELRQTAVAEAGKLKGTEAQVAEARRLINVQLTRDLEALAKQRAEKEAQVLRDIEQLDADLAVRRAQRARATASPLSGPTGGDAEADTEHAARLAALQLALEEELSNEQLTTNERLAIIRQFHEDKAALEQEYSEQSKQRELDRTQFGVEVGQQALQTLGDFSKIASDKAQVELDKEKKNRLKKLEEEYKAGKISKESYEKDKSAIEGRYDQQTRSLKRAAAQEEKKFNIAQSIMLGLLSVIRAVTIPEKIFAGITAAAATAKIIATPIPEFERGGILGRAWRGTKQSVGQAYRSLRTYASGGRINPLGGVADVGQRHGEGGIQMIDGKTGEHLGEWERGEAYMILSRSTVQNNGDLINDLLDTSLYRGGQRVRPRGHVYAEDGALVGDAPTLSRPTPAGQAEVVEAIDRNTAVLRESLTRPLVGIINWGQDDDAYLEGRLDERAAVREVFTG